MVNADIVLLNPAGVGTHFATKVLEGVVVNIVLGALVIEVDLLLAVKLALELVRDLGGGDSVPEFVNQSLSIGNNGVSPFDGLSVNVDLVLTVVHH